MPRRASGAGVVIAEGSSTAMSSERRWMAAVALTLVSSAVPAAADPVQDKERAGAKQTEAQQLFEAGNFAEAEARLREAYALFPSPNMHYSFGRIAEANGRHPDAL